MNAIAPRAPAEHDDAVARLRIAEAELARDQADTAAVNQRIAEIAVVEVDSPVDSGDAHAVAVVAHAGDDLLEDPPRMENALWHF